MEIIYKKKPTEEVKAVLDLDALDLELRNISNKFMGLVADGNVVTQIILEEGISKADKAAITTKLNELTNG